MKVLHLDGGRRWGGGQNQVRLLMRELDRRGDVEQRCLCPRASPLEVRLRAERLPVEGIEWPRGADPRVMIRLFRELRGYDVVHAHDAHALQLALVPARLRGVAVVASRRVIFRTRPAKWNRATRVIAISTAVRQKLESSGVRADRIRTIHSGIDVDEVAALPAASPAMRDRLNLTNDVFVAGNIGTLLDFKHQTVIPQAAARARDIAWVIVGEGPERPTLEEAIKAHGVAANVRLAGAPADARPYLREMDVFVFPSKGEALGTSVLDAMAVGIPVVASDDAGPAEVLGPIHAATGASLFPLDDADALAALVRRLRDDADLRAHIVELQRQRLDAFRIEKTAAAIHAVYEEVAAA